MRPIAPTRGGDSTVKTYAKSHQGYVRLRNEDRWMMRPVDFGGYLIAVADGVGGGPSGGVASRMAIDALDDAAGVDVRDPARLVSAVSMANRRVFETGSGDDALRGMGTTLTTAVVFPTRVLLAHVGDSRAYRLLADGMERLTTDRNMAIT